MGISESVLSTTGSARQHRSFMGADKFANGGNQISILEGGKKAQWIGNSWEFFTNMDDEQLFERQNYEKIRSF